MSSSLVQQNGEANLASGSDMSSLAAVWAYILPALDFIVRSPTPNHEAPTLNVQYHMGVYTVVYNFATAGRNEKHGRLSLAAHAYGLGLRGEDDEVEIRDWDADKADRVKSMIGWELYQKLDDYFRTVAAQILADAPHDDTELLTYYLDAYQRYHAGLAQINRLFAYLNRHFITRAWDEGMGWLCLADIFKLQKRGKKTKKDREKLEARKKEELKKWGYSGGSDEQRKFAERCAEAASPLDRIIPIASLAQRRWRTEVVEPLTFGSTTKASAESPPSPVIATPPSTRETAPIGLVIAAKKKRSKSKNKNKSNDSCPEPAADGENSPLTNGNLNGYGHTNHSAGRDSGPQSRHPSPPPALPPPPKGRLNRAIGNLVMSQAGTEAQRRETALKLLRTLKAAGISSDNLMRKRLDKLLKG